MVEYTGNYFTIKNSSVFDGETVNVLEYYDKDGRLHGTCFKCGKALRRHWWTVQTAEDDVEICDIGCDCVKKLT